MKVPNPPGSGKDIKERLTERFEEYKPVGTYYIDGKTHRHLKKSWDFMCKDEKFNKARTTFRRYMALVANRELRKKVFGF